MMMCFRWLRIDRLFSNWFIGVFTRTKRFAHHRYLCALDSRFSQTNKIEPNMPLTESFNFNLFFAARRECWVRVGGGGRFGDASMGHFEFVGAQIVRFATIE